MSDLPTGTITLLFTDIEGSTRLWEIYPDAMPAAIDRHDTIVRVAVERAGGVVFRTVGDAFFAAFADVAGALAAALQAQRALHAEPWEAIGLPCARVRTGRVVPLRVRMALHTSAVELRGGEYFGPPLNRVARLLAAAHGGQTLLCGDTVGALRESLPDGVALRDMGLHRLRDLQQPIQIFQLLTDDLAADFPPLKTLTVIETRPPSGVALRQAKLPGMPAVDYDALWRQEQQQRERQRKRRRKARGEETDGLF